MIVFLIAFLLGPLARCTTSINANTTVTLTTLATTNLTNSNSVNVCNKLILRNNSIYHLNKKRLIESWPRDFLQDANPQFILNATLERRLNIDFDVDALESSLFLVKRDQHSSS
jgi:hypothetical protein